MPLDTPENRLTVLEGLAEGMSLRSICKAPGFPSVGTVLAWCAAEPEWAEQYARARKAGDDAMAEDIQAIADDEDLDPNDKRVRIDARKWLMAKRQPKKYGDKVLHGQDPDSGPIQVMITRFDANNPTP